jgi:hypothetical protein
VHQHIVRFVGGQLGGTTQAMQGRPFPERITRVPIWAVRSLTETETDGLIHAVQYDEYRFMGERDEDGAYVVRWIRPNVEPLKARIAELELELAAVVRRLDEVLHGPPPRVGLVRVID